MPDSSGKIKDQDKVTKDNILEYKTVNFSIFEYKEDKLNGVELYNFKGYGATFNNADKGDDVCIKGCFANSLKNRIPKLLWNHGYDGTKIPLGIITEAYENEEGLYFKASMPKDDTFVSGRIAPQMKIGSINTMSIGFNTIKAEFKTGENGVVYRLLKELDVWEISLVTFEMNPKAVVTENVKSLIQEIKNITDVSKILKKHFTKSEADDIIFNIKKLSSCNENSNSCNENIFSRELKKYLNNIMEIKKEK